MHLVFWLEGGVFSGDLYDSQHIKLGLLWKFVVNCTICASIRLGQNQGVTQCPILTKTGIDSAVDSLIAMSFGQMMLKCAKEQELIFTPAPGGIF